MNEQELSFFWFRRDLRLHDNAGLYHALKSGYPVQPVFIFDRTILDQLEDRDDARVTFIHDALGKLQQELLQLGSSLEVFYGSPKQAWEHWTEAYKIRAVFTNHDYEPYARQRDAALANWFATKSIPFHTFKDQCIFEYHEVLKDDGSPYTVFTPYSKKWRARLTAFYLKAYPTEKYSTALIKREPATLPSLEMMGFQRSKLAFPPAEITAGLIRQYAEQRDYPAKPGTSRLSVHFRFGTISIREKARKAMGLSDTWLNELIWRDFYMQILWHFPHVAERSFKPAYDQILWRNNPEEFHRWCEGQTGYPIVDAGMRELNATGFMHNRVRMIVASFLTKHLLIDWRWGADYFARKLLDFDLSANNGGWQWAAGSGTDAAPYFRIFNPYNQTEKFDKQQAYIRQWVPEYGTPAYPTPIVQHENARKRCLETYKAALSGSPQE